MITTSAVRPETVCRGHAVYACHHDLILIVQLAGVAKPEVLASMQFLLAQ